MNIIILLLTTRVGITPEPVLVPLAKTEGRSPSLPPPQTFRGAVPAQEPAPCACPSPAGGDLGISGNAAQGRARERKKKGLGDRGGGRGEGSAATTSQMQRFSLTLGGDQQFSRELNDAKAGAGISGVCPGATAPPKALRAPSERRGASPGAQGGKGRRQQAWLEGGSEQALAHLCVKVGATGAHGASPKRASTRGTEVRICPL